MGFNHDVPSNCNMPCRAFNIDWRAAALRVIANKIANGDWQRLPTKNQLGKMDFVALEQAIYDALLTVSRHPQQATT